MSVVRMSGGMLADLTVKVFDGGVPVVGIIRQLEEAQSPNGEERVGLGVFRGRNTQQPSGKMSFAGLFCILHDFTIFERNQPMHQTRWQ